MEKCIDLIIACFGKMFTLLHGIFKVTSCIATPSLPFFSVNDIRPSFVQAILNFFLKNEWKTKYDDKLLDLEFA